MRKMVCFVLAVALLMTSAVALADTVINPQEKRGIKLQPAGLNEVEEGISPTTGLTLSTLYVPDGFSGMALTGRYLPMMVQIDNTDGGVGARAPWGAAYADVVYETSLHRKGDTRLSFIFNDLLPDAVGPIRSARLAHVWIREEWGAGFMYHGRQEYEGTNVLEELRKLGHPWLTDPMIFDNNSGEKAWNRYFLRYQSLASPHNVGGSVSGIYANLVPSDYVAPNHTFKFTDETPEGDTAMQVNIAWKADKEGYVYGSSLIYDIDSNSYLRYMRYGENDLRAWVDKDTEEQIAFANVIIQFTTTKFNSVDAPIQLVTNRNYSATEGNADFFMAGKHIAGYWKRDGVTSRTVYYGPDGEEISLQRGKTLIVIYPDDDVLTYVNGSGNKSNAGNVSYSDR